MATSKPLHELEFLVLGTLCTRICNPGEGSASQEHHGCVRSTTTQLQPLHCTTQTANRPENTATCTRRGGRLGLGCSQALGWVTAAIDTWVSHHPWALMA